MSAPGPTIMAAVDFSEYSLPVLTQAVDICQAFNTHLVLINVINQRDVDAVRYVEPMHIQNVSVTYYIEVQKKQRTQNMIALLEQVKWEQSQTTLLIKVGVPFTQLIRAVEEQSTQMVVMGPKGRTNLSHVFFGATAEKMFRHCPVSLLSVRESGQHGRR